MARIKHIAIRTPDPEKTMAFYRDVFGLKEVGQARTGYYLSDGYINLAILKSREDGSDEMQGCFTCGDGAMVTTDHADHAGAMRELRDDSVIGPRGRRALPPEEITACGARYGISDLNAALGLQQLRKIDRFHAIRSYYVTLYQTGLSDLSELTLPDVPVNVQPAWHLYVVRLADARISRDRFVELLRAENIDARVYDLPLALPRAYLDAAAEVADAFPNTVEACRRAVFLPLYPRMAEADIWDVIRAVRKTVERCRLTT